MITDVQKWHLLAVPLDEECVHPDDAIEVKGSRVGSGSTSYLPLLSHALFTVQFISYVPKHLSLSSGCLQHDKHPVSRKVSHDSHDPNDH